MHTIIGDSVNSLMHNAFYDILNKGTYVGSRNGAATVLYETTLQLTNPRERHLCLEGRVSNIFQMIAETFWVMSGSGVVRDYLEFFLPRARDYSDDTYTWRGAYGPRLYMHNQIQGALDAFGSEGLLTRRSLASIYMPNLDSHNSLQSIYQLDNSKDIPCNNLLYWFCEPVKIQETITEYNFCMRTTQRSGDAIFGAGSINLFEFSFLHEFMYEMVKILHPEAKINLGHYSHYVNNFHLYDFTRAQAEEVVKHELPPSAFTTDSGNDLKFPKTVSSARKFFIELLDLYTFVITDKSENRLSFWTAADEITKIFNEFGLTGKYSYDLHCTTDLLYQYAVLIVAYIMGKKGDKELTPDIHIKNMPTSLAVAVRESKFRSFDITKE